MTAQTAKIVTQLRAAANPVNVEGMARFGINPHNTLGVSVRLLRGLGKQIGKDHALAQELWDTSIHEARNLATLVDLPECVDEAQMERWVAGLDSWDVCDQLCMNLFRWTPFARQKAVEWARRDEEFVKRAGFVLMAVLTGSDKKAPDRDFAQYLPLIIEAATDERNFVKKAVNWALRQIGKRSPALRRRAIRCARQIQRLDSKSARWIARDALRELESEAVQRRLT